MIVTIDGPAGAGKSTVARAVARRLGWGYLNTGAMYRALTWLALRRGVDPADAEGLAELAAENPVRLELAGEGERAFVGALDASTGIRDAAVTGAVSQASAHRAVRAAIVRAQREMLEAGDWVADGRDVGSVVFPDADVKVFLTATPEERARRRRAELASTGQAMSLQEVLADIERRDRFDSSRVESPLVVPTGACVLDSTDLTREQVVGRVLELVERARIPRGASR